MINSLGSILPSRSNLPILISDSSSAFFVPSGGFQMKKFLKFLALCLCLLPLSLSSQQNQEFKEVQEHFDAQKKRIFTAFQREAFERVGSERKLLYQQLGQFISKVDSIENEAYILALIKVKTSEDLSLFSSQQAEEGSSIIEKEPKGKITLPQYPGGMDTFRKELVDLFYYSATETGAELHTELSFVVNDKGAITKVKAKGNNPFFNRQALIATYRLPQTFSPALLDQQPVAYEYQMPIRFAGK